MWVVVVRLENDEVKATKRRHPSSSIFPNPFCERSKKLFMNVAVVLAPLLLRSRQCSKKSQCRINFELLDVIGIYS